MIVNIEPHRRPEGFPDLRLGPVPPAQHRASLPPSPEVGGVIGAVIGGLLFSGALGAVIGGGVGLLLGSLGPLLLQPPPQRGSIKK